MEDPHIPPVLCAIGSGDELKDRKYYDLDLFDKQFIDNIIKKELP